MLLCQSLSYFGTKHTKGKTYEKEEKDDGFVNVGVGIWVDKLRKKLFIMIARTARSRYYTVSDLESPDLQYAS